MQDDGEEQRTMDDTILRQNQDCQDKKELK